MKHLSRYVLPYLFENPEYADDLQNMETIENEDIDDLTIDMIEFLEKSKDAKYIDFPDREFVGIQANILEGNLTYTFMFGYRIKDGYFKWDPDEEDETAFEDADASILINVIFDNYRLHTIQGLVLFPNGDEDYITYYPRFDKPNFSGKAGEL